MIYEQIGEEMFSVSIAYKKNHTYISVKIAFNESSSKRLSVKNTQTSYSRFLA